MEFDYESKLVEIDELINSYKYGEKLREVYYLNNWYRYKKNLKELDEQEWKQARRLFRALKEMSKEDRDFLATKYDRPTIRKGKNCKVHPSDAHVAEELGMEVIEYSKQRREIQRKLKSIMQRQREK